MVRSGIVALAVLVAPAIASAQAPAASPAPTQVAGTAPADKIKCHRSTETGSLASVKKECHTVAEWRQIYEAERNGARDMVDRATARSQ